MELDPLYSYRFEGRKTAGRVYWHAMRRQNVLGEREPSMMHIALVDVDGQVTQPDAEVLTVRTTCSNFDLPSRLPFGLEEGDFAAEEFPAIHRIVALRRPTPSYHPPDEKGQLRRLRSQLSLHHLSLAEEGVTASQQLLHLHN